jgi:large subunit ribosomal protein L15
MDLSNLKPAKGSTKTSKRIGRGQGSGKGGTSTKGTKGGQSRAGYKSKSGFEGGQMPLQRRVPKFGFKNINRKEYVPVNLAVLQRMYEAHKIEKFDMEIYRKYGLASKNDLIKILGLGELKVAIEVTAHKFSKSAVEAIEKVGGKVINL